MFVANKLIGKTLRNRYEILQLLGKGGMGKVYLAKDTRFDKQVVVKVPTMEAGDKEFKDRFMREIASHATLEHLHIVPISDWGEIEGIPFLVLRYLSGGSLRDRITDAQGCYKLMPLEGLNQWLPQIASALDFIHAKNWVHRDLKPDNILFDKAGNPYLADFGIAKALEGAPMGVKTTKGAFIGSLQYMAPEMHLGKGIGPRADQFGLAVLVYEALTGKYPFQGEMPVAIYREIMQGKARPIHELVPGIPLEKSNALMKGIAKEPRDRYGSCGEFANAVTGLMLARGTLSSAGSETPSRVVIPGTRMETPKKPEIPGTRIETRSKTEILGTKIEKPPKTGIKPISIGTRIETSGVNTPLGKKTEIKPAWVPVGLVVGAIMLFMAGMAIVELSTKSTKPEIQNKDEKFAAIENEMVLISAGPFIMGSHASEKGRSDYEEQQVVMIKKPYYMGKYEVTQEQWEAVMGDNSSEEKGTMLPVTNVSWEDCQEFIKKLNQKTDGRYRLPTEEEWECACRAGTITAYSFGDSVTKSDANVRGSSTKAVGCYKANAFGLYDMHGNVWEWCEDCGPEGPATREYRELRGGSFRSHVSDTRSSYHDCKPPSHRDKYGGFRLARDP